jgi:hypothetical protein
MIEGMIGYGRAEEKWLLDILSDAREGKLFEQRSEEGVQSCGQYTEEDRH